MLREEVELALRILSDQFGSAPAKVANVLHQKCGCTLSDLIKALIPPLEYWKIRNALLVMIQHNVVVVTHEKVGGPKPGALSTANAPPSASVARYFVDIKEVLARLRFALFTSMVEQSHGKLARIVVFQVLKLGRAPMDRVVEAAIADPTNHLDALRDPRPQDGEGGDEAEGEEPQGALSLPPGELELAFVSLVADNVLKGVLLPTPDAVLQTAEAAAPAAATAGTRKRAAPKDTAKAKKRVRQGQGAGDGAVDSATAAETIAAFLGEETDPAQPQKETSGGSALVNSKKAEDRDKRAKLRGLIAEFKNKQTVFCINTEHLSMEYCKKTVENLLSARFGEFQLVRLAARSLLSRIRVKDTSPVAMKYGDVEQFVAKALLEQTPTGRLDRQNLTRILDALARHDDQIVRSVTQPSGTRAYTVDWDQASNIISRRIAFNSVFTQFGPHCARLWNYLTSPTASSDEGRQWEDQQLAELVLSGLHEVRRDLLRLSSKGLIQLHTSETPGVPGAAAAAPGGAAKVRGLRFSAKQTESVNQVKGDIIETALKILARKEAENGRIYKFYLRVQTLSHDEEEELHLRERGEDLLELHLLKLSKTLLLLSMSPKT